jgi:hypothetical protein
VKRGRPRDSGRAEGRPGGPGRWAGLSPEGPSLPSLASLGRSPPPPPPPQPADLTAVVCPYLFLDGWGVRERCDARRSCRTRDSPGRPSLCSLSSPGPDRRRDQVQSCPGTPRAGLHFVHFLHLAPAAAGTKCSRARDSPGRPSLCSLSSPGPGPHRALDFLDDPSPASLASPGGAGVNGVKWVKGCLKSPGLC